MGKLTIRKDGEIEREYPLVKERVKIGRAPESDIHIDDPSVSGKHVMISTVLNDSFVQDSGSTNGTFVNGDSVKQQELVDGDMISIGNREITYEKEEYEEAEFEKTIIVTRGSPDLEQGSPQQVKAIEEAEDDARKSAVDVARNVKKCYLKMLTGPAAGKKLEMKKPLVTLGRPGKQVAVVSRRPNGYFFTSVEGAGQDNDYPLVNNEPTGPQTRMLNDSDVIGLAGVQIQVLIRD